MGEREVSCWTSEIGRYSLVTEGWEREREYLPMLDSPEIGRYIDSDSLSQRGTDVGLRDREIHR